MSSRAFPTSSISRRKIFEFLCARRFHALKLDQATMINKKVIEGLFLRYELERSGKVTRLEKLLLFSGFRRKASATFLMRPNVPACLGARLNVF